ncbi:transposable element Tcb1 transposase [Trichonephila clavipes]|nr:transposable element Tcb1 transposase [Trichonephila clavipes]
MFTDESRFGLEPDDKRIRIWRKQGTRNQPQNITELHLFRGGFIMMWSAGIVDDYLESEGNARMAWLAYMADLNPIENLWDALGRAVSLRFPPPATLIELETALQEEWQLLNAAVVDHLIQSIHFMLFIFTLYIILFKSPTDSRLRDVEGLSLAFCTQGCGFDPRRYQWIFHDAKNRHRPCLNGDRYRAMITNFFIPELNNHDVQELWFQQDGTTCHIARATIDLLKDTFGDRLISRFGPVNWPPRSCDLTPLDYFMWGYVKALVYADRP